MDPAVATESPKDSPNMVLVTLDEAAIGLPVAASRPVDVLPVTHLRTCLPIVLGMHGEQDGPQRLEDRGPQRDRTEQ